MSPGGAAGPPGPVSPAVADGLLFDGTTHCSEELPVDWTTEPGPRPEALAERNTSLLRLLSLLEEHGTEATDDKKTGAESEFARLDAKVDLVLSAVSTLLSLHRPPPGSAPIHLSSRGLVWTGAPDLAEGARGRVLIQLNPVVSQPLELPAHVLALDRGVQPHRTWLGFEALPENLAALLERYTFRRHRRAVAGMRQAMRPASQSTT